MFDYIVEYKNKSVESIVDLEKAKNKKWDVYNISDKCKLFISQPKSKGEIYFFKNVVIWGKLFEKKNEKSSNALASKDRLLSSKELIDSFWGSYIALFFDNDEIKVLRDPSASKECLWSKEKQRVLVFSDVQSIFKMTPKRFDLDHKYIASSLYLSRVNNERTALKDVMSLKAGYSLNTRLCEIECHWSPVTFVKNKYHQKKDINEIEIQLKDTIIDCVKTWGDCYESVLLNLSGGLDSSIVAICLKKYSKSLINALNISFDSITGDEVEYAKEVCEKYDIPLHVFKLVDPKIILKDRLSNFHSQHRPLKFGLGFECLEEEESLLQETKAQAIFSGCGGDVLFQSKNSIFISQDYYKDLGLKGLFKVSRNIAEMTERTVWDIFTKSIANKYFQGRKYLFEGNVNKKIMHEKYLDTVNNDFVSHPWHHIIKDINNGKKFQISGLVDTENFYTYRKTSEYVDIIHPLLSQPIIELCLSLPSYILTPNLINRGLFRDAFKFLLPDSIYLRRSKGKIGKFYDELITYNYDDIRGELIKGNLIGLEILSKAWLEENIDRAKIDQNIRSQLFQLMMIESWLGKLIKDNRSEKK